MFPWLPCCMMVVQQTVTAMELVGHSDSKPMGYLQATRSRAWLWTLWLPWLHSPWSTIDCIMNTVAACVCSYLNCKTKGRNLFYSLFSTMVYFCTCLPFSIIMSRVQYNMYHLYKSLTNLSNFIYNFLSVFL